jgi:uncharacterized membrane protein YkvA (DUF1232 family)
VGLWQLMLVGVALLALLYVLFVGGLILAGRWRAARAVAGFVPDCLLLFRRLVGDPRVPRRKKIVLAALVPYLAMPIDLVPDFIPVAGYLDDAVLVALVLRYVLRGGGAGLIEEHWSGPPASLAVILRLAGYAPA